MGPKNPVGSEQSPSRIALPCTSTTAHIPHPLPPVSNALISAQAAIVWLETCHAPPHGSRFLTNLAHHRRAILPLVRPGDALPSLGRESSFAGVLVCMYSLLQNASRIVANQAWGKVSVNDSLSPLVVVASIQMRAITEC